MSSALLKDKQQNRFEKNLPRSLTNSEDICNLPKVIKNKLSFQCFISYED